MTCGLSANRYHNCGTLCYTPLLKRKFCRVLRSSAWLQVYSREYSSTRRQAPQYRQHIKTTRIKDSTHIIPLYRAVINQRLQHKLTWNLCTSCRYIFSLHVPLRYTKHMIVGLY